MLKMNCWEQKKCGREPGGAKVKEFGVCPASLESRLDGINSGIYGGRACWPLKGTLCDDRVQGSFAEKLIDCMECDFYRMVGQEEGEKFESSRTILKIISS